MTAHDPFFAAAFRQEFYKRAEQADLKFSEQDIHNIAERHLEDLTHIPGVFFDSDTKEFISVAAARHLAQTMAEHQTLSAKAGWDKVRQSFKNSKYWGFTTHTEEQSSKRVNVGRELFAYIWTMIQALLIMKVVIFYFGLKSAAESEPMDMVWLVLAISFSFGSLFFFAWRKSRKKKRKP